MRDTVGAIARLARVKKLVPTHVRRMSEALMRTIAEDAARDFDGPVVLGADLTEVPVYACLLPGPHRAALRRPFLISLGEFEYA